jgi:hypothetical protein
MEEMWKELGDDTILCIANGANGLAEYWESAWLEGRSDQNAKTLPKLIPTIEDTDLMKLYRDKTSMPSKFISEMKLP